jgi:hypothetical protein
MTQPSDSGPPGPGAADGGARFRANVVRVLAVQLVWLVLLWLLQSRYAT